LLSSPSREFFAVRAAQLFLIGAQILLALDAGVLRKIRHTFRG